MHYNTRSIMVILITYNLLILKHTYNISVGQIQVDPNVTQIGFVENLILIVGPIR
jgi:hypothetical protein